jgi:RNA polymerase sigma-70 factor (ECF subfamily)
MARLAVGNVDDALDIVQDSMTALVQKYADRSEVEWPPLFYRILQSRIRDFYRRSKVRNRWRVWLDRFRAADEPGHCESVLEAQPDPAAMTPEQSVDQEQSLQAIEQALSALPQRQQQAFLLRAWQGLDTAETAFAMGCSEGSVKTHYSRAVHRLRELLQDLQL